MTRRAKRALVVGCTLAAMAGGIAVTSAATAGSGSESTIHACAHKVTGNLRLANTCRRTETPVSWSIQGPAGPPGPAELQVTLREFTRTFTVQPVSDGQGPNGVYAGCKQGETVLSGGLTAYGADLLPLQPFTSGPSFDGNRSGWIVEWINPTDEAVTATVTMTALCTAGSMTNPG